jgi:DNA-binding GntR family transcriptional regulator
LRPDTPMDRLSTPSTISQQVYERLRREVLTGSLGPGRWLRELELAGTLGVSRTPVREAVRRLAQEGLLELSPNRGVRVRSITLEEMVDVYRVRELVESAAAAAAARHRTHDDVARLHDLLAAIAAIPAEDAALHIETDDAFHESIALAARSAALLDVVRLLNRRVTRVKILTRDTNASAGTREQHRAIVDAIAAGDAAEAEAAMRRHIATYRDLLAQRLGHASREAAAADDAPRGRRPTSRRTG